MKFIGKCPKCNTVIEMESIPTPDKAKKVLTNLKHVWNDLNKFATRKDITLKRKKKAQKLAKAVDKIADRIFSLHLKN